jgi:Rho termination factor, N-terminal domain
MNIPETFYIALCVTILMLGVVYWFWTQIQYLQKKVNLLDNVVYEMKTLVSNLPGPHMAPQFIAEPTYPKPVDVDSAPYQPPPESVAGDLEAERLDTETEFETFAQPKPVENYAPPPELIVAEQLEEVNDDLQPGAPIQTESKKKTAEQDASGLDSPLNSLSIKELRSMAEANSIPGASEMRKRDLVRVLRSKVSRIINNSGPENVLSLDAIDAPSSD